MNWPEGSVSWRSGDFVFVSAHVAGYVLGVSHPVGDLRGEDLACTELGKAFVCASWKAALLGQRCHEV